MFCHRIGSDVAIDGLGGFGICRVLEHFGRAFSVKAWNFAQVYIIPNRVNLAIEPSQISPVGAVAAILRNGRYVTTISETKRLRAIIFDSICRFYGAYISEKVLPKTS